MVETRNLSQRGHAATPSTAVMDLPLLISLYVVEGAMFALALAAYKYADRLMVLTARQWLWIVLPALTAVATGTWIVRRFLYWRTKGSRSFVFTAAANLLPVTVLLLAGEIGVRLLSTPTTRGISFAGSQLLPRSWDRTRKANETLLAASPANISYFVSDTLLGWSVGATRRSKDGLYLSSAEGIRSPRVGISFRSERPMRRIAATGDSFTFGLEVPYEDTWEYHLQQSLGADTQVLDFGVDGYGVDQAVLRYRRDASPWRADVAILGLINHDFYRTLSVYTFLTFPDWGFPFSKPRFVRQGERLTLVNVPVTDPHDIVAVRSEQDLPFVQLDPGYDPHEWQRHWYDASYLVRYVRSRFPRWQFTNGQSAHRELLEINVALIMEFAREVAASGGTPMIVYFPARSDFEADVEPVKDEILARIRRAGIVLVDLTACIRELGTDRAFNPGHPHYSPAGNAAAARCLLPEVQRLLSHR